MIKPSHYDDDGYPITWEKSAMPSNTLACINGLAEDARNRGIFGSTTDLRLYTYDETSERVQPHRIIRAIRHAGGRALVALVGVQSNQFPRAVDLARPFVKAGFSVCIGGFHVSGCVAMLPELPAEIREAQALGISLFAGEAENGRLDRVLTDARAGKLAPLYNYMNDLPGLEGEPAPILPPALVQRVNGDYSCMDLGRGCPYQCSFCTIINVQGRKSRFRSADDVERIIRTNYANGIRRFFITDDNFARNRNWRALFERITDLRTKEGMDLGFTLQVDTQCHRIDGFIESAAKAGVEHVFIGLESINREVLLAAKKQQNKISDYRTMLQQWRSQGVITLAGYILGFPGDTKASILRDVEIIKRELPIDILEFFMFTPLPGSEDHKKMLAQDVWMDPDLNKYDLNHRTIQHGQMSAREWEEARLGAWKNFYTKQQLQTILRRAAANPRGRLETLAAMLLGFSTSIHIEGVHPLESGLTRKIYRTDRRPQMKQENPLVFYPRRFAGSLRKLWRYRSSIRWIERISKEIMADPKRFAYLDESIATENRNSLNIIENPTQLVSRKKHPLLVNEKTAETS